MALHTWKRWCCLIWRCLRNSCGSAGELYDLLEAKSAQLHAVGPDRMSAVELFHDLALKGRCSALITVTRKIFVALLYIPLHSCSEQAGAIEHACDRECPALKPMDVCAADFSNLFMGHSTWDSYSQMIKLFKHYSFQLHVPGVAAQRMSFSSYPGELFSDDDLYAFTPYSYKDCLVVSPRSDVCD